MIYRKDIIGFTRAVTPGQERNSIIVIYHLLMPAILLNKSFADLYPKPLSNIINLNVSDDMFVFNSKQRRDDYFKERKR